MSVLLLDTALTYFRQYLLDLKSVRSNAFQITTTPPIVTPDTSITYFRQYLGRI